MTPNNILQADMLDIVFEHRNKNYGAYALRKGYSKRILLALLITVSLGFLFFLLTFLFSKIEIPIDKMPNIRELSLSKISDEDKKIEIPKEKPITKQELKLKTTSFVTPVIKDDKDVDKPAPTKDDLKLSQVSNVNQDGIDDANIVTSIQDDRGVIKKPDINYDDVFVTVQQQADFPGGAAAWKKYLKKNLDPMIPVDNGAPSGQYTVIVKFIVDKAGNISEVQATTKFGFGMEEEAIRVIKNGPRWTPGFQNSIVVSSWHLQPITFVVNTQEE